MQVIKTFPVTTLIGLLLPRALVAQSGPERLSPSIEDTVWELTQKNEDMSTVTRLIETVQLGAFMDDIPTLTFFSPVNSAWVIIIPMLDVQDVLMNLMFDQLWFVDDLADGQQITSTNGKVWKIQVLENPTPLGGDGEPAVVSKQQSGGEIATAPRIYFSNADGPEGLTNCTFIPGPNRTNILAKNGVIHHIDCLFLDYNFTRFDPNGPTFAPIGIQAPPPVTSAPVSLAPSPVPPESTPSSAFPCFKLWDPKVWATMIALGVAVFI